MIITASLSTAAKNLVAVPAIAAFSALTLPALFAEVGTFLGPHVLAGIGAVMGTAIRYQVLKLAWAGWYREAFAAAGLGLAFGNAEIPVITGLLERTSPEMFPVANGTAIGILMASGAGFLADFIKAYRKGETKP